MLIRCRLLSRKKLMKKDFEKYDGIILDIDGTIWNTTGIVSHAWNQAVKNTGFGVKFVTAQVLQQEFGKTMDVIAADLWPELEVEKRNALLEECCSMEQIALRENNLDITYPGVTDTIKEMAVEHNFYIVSNCQDGYIELMMEKTGLTPYIKDWECFGRTGKGKCENIMMLSQRNQLTCPVYVGDTQGDKEACNQAGVPFIWAAYGFGKVDEYFDKIESFSSLKRLV